MINTAPNKERDVIQWGIAVVWFVVGVKLIQTSRRIISDLAAKQTQTDIRVRMLINRGLSAVGYAFVLLISLHLLQIKIGSILVGGAVTGVIVGVSAQSTLANLFAGLVLFTLRPFSVGQFIILRTYLFGGVEYRGTVLDVNWYHTVLMDGEVKRLLPNSSIIISAITVSSDPDAKLFTIPLPYTIPFHDFEERLHSITNYQAALSVKEFSDYTYTVQVRFPASVDLDLVREAIADLRTKEFTGRQL